MKIFKPSIFSCYYLHKSISNFCIFNKLNKYSYLLIPTYSVLYYLINQTMFHKYELMIVLFLTGNFACDKYNLKYCLGTIRITKLGVNMKDDDRLDSWKEIAFYVNREIRTCQRWEKKLHFPVYRIDNESSNSKVFTYKSEIDLWFKNKTKKIENK